MSPAERLVLVGVLMFVSGFVAASLIGTSDPEPRQRSGAPPSTIKSAPNSPTSSSPPAPSSSTVGSAVSASPSGGDFSFPTVESTGSRVAYSEMEPSGSVTTSHDGQVIEGMDIKGRLTIQHDNVIVRDSRIQYTVHYGVYVIGEGGGPCPTGTLLEHVEIDGTLSTDDMIPLYSPGCEWTLDHAYVHDSGRAVRLVRNNTVTNSYIIANHGGDSGSHRGAIGLNGGNNHVIRNNVLICDTPKGCSAALAMYGDFHPIEDILVEHNLMAATADYCAYGGSVDSKPFPDASNVRFIDNHFSTMLFPDCGRSGPITAFDRNVRGNVWEGNIWHETGQPIP